MKLRLSETAASHLDDIYTYTTESFGIHQWLIYSGALETAFSTLCQFPEIGLHNNGLPEGCRAFRVRQHWIVYKHDAQILDVLAIIRERSEFES